jgi:cysteine desulfurase
VTGRPVQTIYMDHAATTPLSPDALSAMQPFFAERFGNASSIYSLGQDARQAVDQARQRCAAVLNARPSEIVFTSGGTESDNAALMGAAIALRERGNHIVTTRIEHHAVLNAAELLEKLGFDVTYVSPGRDGVVSPEAIEAALTPATSVVSVMLANNETGVIQPIAAITERVKRIATEQRRTIVMHTDAVQAAGYLSLDVDALGVDLLSLSAHKFNGPKGVGLLYMRRNTPFAPTQVGGAQERDRRAGTENTPGIVGMSVALEAADASREASAAKCLVLRDRLVAGITERIEDAHLNGHPTRRLPNNVNFTFARVEAEPLLMGLDLAGVAASSGSACTAASLEPSHVLIAMGNPVDQARSSLRLTPGPENTEEEVDYVVDTVAELVLRLRAMTGRSRRR